MRFLYVAMHRERYCVGGDRVAWREEGVEVWVGVEFKAPQSIINLYI